VAVKLLMQVSRGEDSRLTGTVHAADGTDTRRFSGTLELMRVFEELVPVAGRPEATDAASTPEHRGGPDDAGQDDRG
jgi:hypothetical protein